MSEAKSTIDKKWTSGNELNYLKEVLSNDRAIRPFTDRLEEEFPNNKAWWANIERDPRIRLKIDGKIYEATAALVQDYDEVIQLFGSNPITTRVDENGNEQVAGLRYYWRVLQRNIRTYGEGSVM